MATKIEDWFNDGEEFEELLEQAYYNANEKEEEFIDEVKEKWKEYGMRAYLSTGQLRYIKQIAERE